MKDESRATKKINEFCTKNGTDKNKLYNELQNTERFSSDEEYLKILEIIEFHLLSSHEKNKQSQGNHCHYIVNLLKDFAQKNYSKNFTITSFAKAHKVNAKYLGRLYKTQEGVAITEYVNSLRLEKALRLIQNTDKKIIDIAFSVGFSNIGYFNRSFKAKYGSSPRSFRK